VQLSRGVPSPYPNPPPQRERQKRERQRAASPKKREGLGRLHDGSEPDKRLTPGYALFAAYIRARRLDSYVQSSEFHPPWRPPCVCD
jgi:hypothetical protein